MLSLVVIALLLAFWVISLLSLLEVLFKESNNKEANHNLRSETEIEIGERLNTEGNILGNLHPTPHVLPQREEEMRVLCSVLWGAQSQCFQSSPPFVWTPCF